MSTKHTPIPWEIRERTVDGEVVQCDIYHGEMRIGSVTIRPDRPWSENGRLMADAPNLLKERDRLREQNSDLLEVLEANLQAWEGEEDSAKEEHADLIEETRAALAKARGEVAA